VLVSCLAGCLAGAAGLLLHLEEQRWCNTVRVLIHSSMACILLQNSSMQMDQPCPGHTLLAAALCCCFASCSCSLANLAPARRSLKRSARACRSSDAALVWLGLLRSLVRQHDSNRHNEGPL